MSNIVLKPCPFCGGNAEVRAAHGILYAPHCLNCGARSGYCNRLDAAAEAWNHRAPSVSTALFDKEERYEDCTVQVLTNTVTGQQSVGWWRNDAPPTLTEREYE